MLAGVAAMLSRHWTLLRTFLRRCGAVASFSSVEARRAAAKASSCVRSLAVLSCLALQALAELELARSVRSASLESQLLLASCSLMGPTALAPFLAPGVAAAVAVAAAPVAVALLAASSAVSGVLSMSP